ncbi:universal stress protein [Amycolatopsis sp. cmx-4-68]|uniref:universal stress protein n=1 Tax=Amycolatopsis sp. cmx-4-68 TaxID=2790938 RepID=UPI00397BD430
MSAPGNAPVVVAVDGSETAAAAALWAGEEAVRRHAALLVFTAYGYEDEAIRPPSDWLAVKEAEAGRLLRQTRATLESAVPGLEIATEAGDRGPVPGLLEVSERARILVTGEPVGAIAGNVAFQGEGLQDAGRRLLAQRLAGWQEKYPEVRVERRVEHDRPRDRLLDLSREAQLVVVGSRGRGGFAGLVLGSTSQALLHHAGCPVMVVRTENA